MNAHYGPALLTLATSLLLFGCAAYVGRCRIRFAIQAPATTGHPQFDIAYRIQMNTLESTMLFLPTLWVCALYGSDPTATAAGSVWLVARAWYALAYARDPNKRGPAFLLSMLAFGALLVGGAWGLLHACFA